MDKDTAETVRAATSTKKTGRQTDRQRDYRLRMKGKKETN